MTAMKTKWVGPVLLLSAISGAQPAAPAFDPGFKERAFERVRRLAGLAVSAEPFQSFRLEKAVLVAGDKTIGITGLAFDPSSGASILSSAAALRASEGKRTASCRRIWLTRQS